MTMSIISVRKGLLTLIFFSVGVIALIYWGRLEDLQAAFRTSKPRLFESTWTWECDNEQCMRRERDSKSAHVSLATCRMECGPPPLWPRPTGIVDLGSKSTAFSLQNLRFEISKQTTNAKVRALLAQAAEVFQENLRILVPKGEPVPQSTEKLSDLVVLLNVVAYEKDPLLTLKTDESYRLIVRNLGSVVRAEVSANSYFGVRHGLETLSQLIWWGEGAHRTLRIVHIVDSPKFAHRGVLIDTARNYLPVSALRRTVDALAASKLNTLHWHLTDSQSFPFDSPRVPNMARHGAYSPKQVYNAGDIAEIVAYARVRGVRVLLEIDAPAHAGNGWQWGEREGLGNLSLCVNQQPWRQFCGEPPCGQLNPDNPYTYKVLGEIYRDLVELSNVTDMFHMGGDEVNLNCWASSMEETQSHEELMHKWAKFHEKALELLAAANKGRIPKAVVMWSSELTKRAREFLNKKVHVIQTWGVTSWGEADALLQEDFRVIISHVDAWYLDCGFGSWRGPGPGSCEPIANIHSIYQHRPWEILRVPHKKLELILGAEVCLWGEMVDENSVDMKLWPRAAAFAERMWTDPDKDVVSDVQSRLAAHRERLVARGVRADAIWPEWCNHNPTQCLDSPVSELT